MELIDTHAHLTYTGLKERIPEVLANCAAEHVTQVISIASHANDAMKALELARAHAMVYCSAGVHPHEAAKVGDGEVERIAEMLDDPNVVAVGELGLDYHYDFAERDTQKRIFAEQLAMASGHDLPLVIHCRDAFDDCIAMLEDHGFRDRRVVVHCFTGTADEAARVAERGWRISFTGIVTFKNSTDLQAIARDYPADKIMIETDSPYLTPAPIRHVRPNEPAFVAHTARFLAELRGESLEDFARQSTANARGFFGIA